MRAPLVSLFLGVWLAAATATGAGPSATPPAKGRFLIASHSLGDPHFAETVILLLAYGPGGAMGVIINRPTEVRLATALPKVDELHERTEHLFAGGPVSRYAMLLLVRAAKRPKSAEVIFGDVYASGSLTVLRRALGRTGKTDRWRAYAGYAGWGTGQLEQEIGRGDWHVADADVTTLFDTEPDQIWSKLIERFSGEWTRDTGASKVALD